jgi:hypothetical protein
MLPLLLQNVQTFAGEIPRTDPLPGDSTAPCLPTRPPPWGGTPSQESASLATTVDPGPSSCLSLQGFAPLELGPVHGPGRRSTPAEQTQDGSARGGGAPLCQRPPRGPRRGELFWLLAAGGSPRKSTGQAGQTGQLEPLQLGTTQAPSQGSSSPTTCHSPPPSLHQPANRCTFSSTSRRAAHRSPKRIASPQTRCTPRTPRTETERGYIRLEAQASPVAARWTIKWGARPPPPTTYRVLQRVHGGRLDKRTGLAQRPARLEGAAQC